MLPAVIAYLLLLVVWGALSWIAVRQVYQHAHETDKLSRNLTMIYIVLSILLALNGLRILLSLRLDQLFI